MTDHTPAPENPQGQTPSPKPIRIEGAPGTPGSTALTPEQIAHKASARASWHRRASKPVSVWMILLFISIFVHRWIPNSIWLMVHMVTLGLITNSILIWSQHFTEALLKNRRPEEERRGQVNRIYVLNASMVVLMVGVVFALYPLTLIGSIGVGGVVAWHGIYLLNQLREALPARFDSTVRFYIAAAWLLPVGAAFGALLANNSFSASRYSQLLLAHEATNILGFVGITVVGTLVTLWPTMLRTKMKEGAVRSSNAALFTMCAGLALTTGGALVGLGQLAGAGLVIYALGLLVVAVLMVRTCTVKKPSDYPTLSVAAGFSWLVVGVIWAAVLLFTSPLANLNLRLITPVFVAGFLLQVLLGAMSYLLPVGMGGGPAAVRAANREFNRFSFGRVSIINICLFFFVLPTDFTGSWVRATTSVLGALTFASFIPLMLRGVRRSVAARKEVIAARARGEKPQPTPEGLAPARPNVRRELLLGGGAALAAVAAGVAIAPSSSRLFRAVSDSGAAGTGQTTRVTVEATADMRFVPDSIEVPAGNSLVVEVKNTDTTNVHDLYLDTNGGVQTGRIDPGESKTLEAGVISSDVEGWCTIVGHRAMGMTLSVVAIGASGQGSAGSHDSHAHSHSASETMTSSEIDFQGELGSGYEVRDAVLSPVGEGEIEDGRTVHRVTLDVTEVQQEVAPGVSIRSWTFAGRYMGPILHAKLGDIFEITLVNSGTMGHSIDFHAGMVSPDENMRTIAPGESLVYRFEATGSGIWLYHCSTSPMSSHIAAGMFGAVVVDPESLDGVDREYVLVQNETYLADTGEGAHEGNRLTEVSPEGVDAGRPTLALWNGHATQYVARPLEARVGERVRIWVLAAGPARGTSFHVVGSQFDTVYKEGAYLLRGGRDSFGGSGGHSQALDLSAAQGGFVEMEFLEAGTYTFVNHDFSDMERGARGLIRVSEAG